MKLFITTFLFFLLQLFYSSLQCAQSLIPLAVSASISAINSPMQPQQKIPQNKSGLQHRTQTR